MDKLTLQQELIKVLGPEGLNLQIKRRYPAFSTRLILHRVYIYSLEHGQLWHGDIDFSYEEAKLKRLAQRLHCTFYFLKEQHARFNLQRPQLEHTLIKITSKKVIVNDFILNLYHRDKRGKWCLKNEATFLVPNLRD